MVVSIEVYRFMGTDVKLFVTDDGKVEVAPRHFFYALDFEPSRATLVGSFSVRATKEYLDAIKEGEHFDVARKKTSQLAVISLQDMVNIFCDANQVRQFVKLHFDGVINLPEKRVTNPKGQEVESESESDSSDRVPLKKHPHSPPSPDMKQKSEQKKLRVIDEFVARVMPKVDERIKHCFDEEYRRAFVAANEASWRASYDQRYTAEIVAQTTATARAQAQAEAEAAFNQAMASMKK